MTFDYRLELVEQMGPQPGPTQILDQIPVFQNLPAGPDRRPHHLLGPPAHPAGEMQLLEGIGGQLQGNSGQSLPPGQTLVQPIGVAASASSQRYRDERNN